MRTRTRRRLDVALLAAGGLVVGGVGVAGAIGGDVERMPRFWAAGELGDDGTFEVLEVVDWDFGGIAVDKHGIFRDVPGLSPDAAIDVGSPDAPDEILVTPRVVAGEDGARIRIGDPNTTVSGSKEYTLRYPLTTGIVDGDAIRWDAVGTEWPVEIEEAEVHLLAPTELTDVRCFQGAAGSTDPCDARVVEPGLVAVTVEGLDSGEGVTIEATAGAPLAAAPARPDPPTTPPPDEGTGVLPPAGTAALATLAGAVPLSIMVRRAGRERVAPGGAADAAYGGTTPRDAPPGAVPPGPSDNPGPPVSEVRVDADELAALATIDFAPPEGLRPEHGGIVLVEAVRPEHKTAWLIEAAIDGAVDLQEEGGRKVRLVRTGDGTPETQPILDQAFGGRDQVSLGTYDPTFARAWSKLGNQLDAWRDVSGFWDQRANTRRTVVLVLGIVVAVVGALAVAGGAALAAMFGAPWLALVAVGGLIAGGGLAAAIRSWELRVRTPAGSAAWLRVESFRRFLAESEAYHAEEAAKRGVLREYTAWALALGEIDRWGRAVAASTNIPQDAGLNYVYIAPILALSTTSAATAPSSSGGGGGGGSVGGGGGGGGGGSW